MGLIWHRLHVNPEWMLILYVIWEASVLVGKLLALQECSAGDWMTKEFYIHFCQGKVFYHLHSIQTMSKASSASYSVHTQGKWPGWEANYFSLSSAGVKNVWSCRFCTSASLCTLIVWCLIKYGDSFTLHEVFSCWWVVLLAAQTVVWTIGGGLAFKIMYLFTGDSDKCHSKWRRLTMLSLYTLSGTTVT